MVCKGRRLRMTAQDEDAKAIEAYRKKYGQGPFIAADVVVVSADGCVLLVKRSSAPGKGKWALPGGFVDADETFLHAAIRELEEETGIRLADLISGEQVSPEDHEVFDGPDRDPRARIVSVAFLFRLPQQSQILSAKAGDDAAGAEWIGLDDLPGPDRFYSDHHQILRRFGLIDQAR
jgi:bifunctional NMN adenylyltransferase/nudix hydrolase